MHVKQKPWSVTTFSLDKKIRDTHVIKMNVVGKVRSLISQGVYSVATPFHPFGGAVDIIVVEQQDGTYQSTPWYVRFGKFQGVLKGTENTILISVNGVETDVNMLLDNSGEAYFARLMLAGDQEEADTQSSIDIHNDYANSVSISSTQDTSNSNFYSSSNVDYAENNEQENDAFCNGLQTFNVASNGSSELDSHNYGDLHEVVVAAESSQDSSTEMVFVSVNGHVLTAPISESEENVENLELTSPKIYLGPDESSNEELISNGQAAGSAFINDAESSSPFCNHNIFSLGVPKDWHDLDSTHNEENLETTMTYKKVDPQLSKNETFMSCLDFSELISDMEETNSWDLGSPNAVNTMNVVKGPEEDKKEAVNDIKEMEQIKHESVICDRKELETKEDKNAATIIPKVEIDNVSAYPKHDVRLLGTQQPHPEAKLTDDSRIAKGASGHGLKGNDHDIISTPKYDIEQDEHAQSGLPWITNEDFEVSLCGNLLCPGVGSKFAAEVFETHRISKCETSVHLIARNERLILRFRGKYFSWNKVAPIVLGENLSIQLKDPIPVEEENTNPINSGEDISNSSLVGPGWRLWPIPFRRTRSPPSAAASSVGLDDSRNLQEASLQSHSSQFPPEEFIRTNIPTTEQITSLNLKYGQNLITFTFCTRVLGRQQVDAHIYLWKWNARIVISDVDGTITKSDVLGQFMPLMGKDWTQSGVAHLFSAIKENGYQLLFLSARAIVQSYLTRNFLRSLRQDGQTLPNGPIVISPDGLFPSLYREVIRRTPHEFKIACLEDIKALFPSGHNPFYAGFGNRDTDELSYQKIGIPKGKIFIINPKGEVAINRHIDVKTYTSLHSLVDDMFPPTSLIEQEDYNSWNYWKVPLPHIDC